MDGKNIFDGDELLKSIKEDSKKRRENPIDFFCEFLRGFWMDNTSEEAMFQWKEHVREFPWYADDALYCINEIIMSPPDNLIELVQQNGWLYLDHETYNEIIPYTFKEYINWIKQMKDEFQEIYNNAPIEER